jgi:hypothetical protein
VAKKRHYPPVPANYQEPAPGDSLRIFLGIPIVVGCTVIGLNIGPALLGYPSPKQNENLQGLALILSLAGSLPGFIYGHKLAEKVLSK